MVHMCHVAPCLPSRSHSRFEDRYRLPLGVGLNMTSYAAKIMSEVRAACMWTSCWAYRR